MIVCYIKPHSAWKHNFLRQKMKFITNIFYHVHVTWHDIIIDRHHINSSITLVSIGLKFLWLKIPSGHIIICMANQSKRSMQRKKKKKEEKPKIDSVQSKANKLIVNVCVYVCVCQNNCIGSVPQQCSSFSLVLFFFIPIVCWFVDSHFYWPKFLLIKYLPNKMQSIFASWRHCHHLYPICFPKS